MIETDRYLPPWGQEDDDAAQSEGWALFDYNSTGLLEVERVDEDEVFENDDEALRHVEQKVVRGSDMHIRAWLIHHLYALSIMAAREEIYGPRETWSEDKI